MIKKASPVSKQRDHRELENIQQVENLFGSKKVEQIHLAFKFIRIYTFSFRNENS